MESRGEGSHELLPPADAAQARALTGELREAMTAVRRAGAVLAEAVRRAHDARVWLALGYTSWADYARGELGISRAQAYRLIEIAVTTEQLREASDALGVSPVGDLELSGRALRDLHGRVEEFTDELADRLAAGDLTGEDDAAALVREVVGKIRGRRPGLPDAPVGGSVEDARVRVERLRLIAAELGQVILEFAPAYHAETDVADLVSVFADDVGIPVEEAMACRRYAITGDVRCLDRID
ncbi:hypothetical protein ABZ540_35770 [Nocardia xishanensis]|uniref:hypothetical protein n=1 Tax=Nocardia xishanensis TaxID=238964 RepID=UPI0033FEF511